MFWTSGPLSSDISLYFIIRLPIETRHIIIFIRPLYKKCRWRLEHCLIYFDAYILRPGTYINHVGIPIFDSHRYAAYVGKRNDWFIEAY